MPDIFNTQVVLDSYLKTNWSNTLIAWENLPFDPPKASWIEPIMSIDVSQNVTIGLTRKRHFGTYTIRIFCPLSKGSSESKLLADQLIAIMENKRLDPDLLTYSGTFNRVGNDGHGWYQANILITFTSDETP